MPGKNKTPLLGWHPPAELSAWVREEAKRRGVPLSVVLNDALEAYRLRPGVEPPHDGDRQQDDQAAGQARKHDGSVQG
jgi:hypothetical protein